MPVSMMPILIPAPSAPIGRPMVFAQTLGVPRNGTLFELVGYSGSIG